MPSLLYCIKFIKHPEKSTAINFAFLRALPVLAGPLQFTASSLYKLRNNLIKCFFCLHSFKLSVLLEQIAGHVDG